VLILSVVESYNGKLTLGAYTTRPRGLSSGRCN
jgi:hypothetical protein